MDGRVRKGSDAVIVVDLLVEDAAADPYARFGSLAAACPIHRARFAANGEPATGPLGGPLWLTTGYDATSEALLSDGIAIDPTAVLPPEALAGLPMRDPELLPIFRNLLSLDPPDHTRLRRLVQPAFTARAVQPLRPRIRALADGLLDEAERAATARGEGPPDRTMDLMAAYATPLPIAVIFELTGVPATDRERVWAWAQELLRISPAADAAGIRAALLPFVNYTRELVAAKRAAPADDLLSVLIAAEEDGDRLDEGELLSMVFLLILAGFVTTVNLIGNGVFALLGHPAELDKLRADPSRTPDAVEEILRFWGPIEIASERYAARPMTIGGQSVERGEVVVPALAAANRDPARFVHPERFDISRADANRHVAFGKGVHACLGAPLARLEGTVALEALLERYPDLRLAAPAAEIRWHPGPLRGLAALPVAF